MNTNDNSTGGSSAPHPIPPPLRPPVATIVAGLLSWAVISLGFLGLKMLMQERPEFVGQPMRGTKVEMIQESPRIVALGQSETSRPKRTRPITHAASCTNVPGPDSGV